jgi:hypothetical protein
MLFVDLNVCERSDSMNLWYYPGDIIQELFTTNRSCRTLPSHRTYTHTPQPNKPVDPQVATSPQLEVHATHTKNCECSTS